MGHVYRAVKEGDSTEVALKVMANGGQGRAADRFLAEAKAMAAIKHPNVVRCYDVGQAGGELYMAMELLAGGDAEQLMSKHGGVLDERTALRIIRDAARGLEALEERGLVHRDIKPDNIFWG